MDHLYAKRGQTGPTLESDDNVTSSGYEEDTEVDDEKETIFTEKMENQFIPSDNPAWKYMYSKKQTIGTLDHLGEAVPENENAAFSPIPIQIKVEHDDTEEVNINTDNVPLPNNEKSLHSGNDLSTYSNELPGNTLNHPEEVLKIENASLLPKPVPIEVEHDEEVNEYTINLNNYVSRPYYVSFKMDNELIDEDHGNMQVKRVMSNDHHQGTGVNEAQITASRTLETHTVTESQENQRLGHSEEEMFVCQICNKSFGTESQYYAHQRNHKLNTIHKCHICYNTFRTAITLQVHIRDHKPKVYNPEEQKLFQCLYCSESFPTKPSKNVHEMKHRGYRAFRCHYCYKRFTTLESKLNHVLIHLGRKQYECKVCDKTFRTTFLLRKHTKMHFEPKTYKCSLCNQILKSQSSLVSHEKSHSGLKCYKCEICSKEYTQLRYLRDHRRMHTGERPFKCSTCGKAYARKSTLIAHESIHSAPEFSCDVCGKKFHQLQQMKTHKWVHNPQKRVKCPTCGNTYSSKYDMVRHQRLHNGHYFSCKICLRNFQSKSLLAAHERTHFSQTTKGITVKCPVCDKSLKRTYLSSHIKIHNDDRRFLCKICGMTFIYKSSLQKHGIVHTNEKPFKCRHCEVRCKRSHERTNHEKTHFDEKPFQCKLCGKAFKIAKYLKTHEQASHINPYRYKCRFCGVPKRDKYNLAVHERIHTGGTTSTDTNKEALFKCHYCEKTFYTKTRLVQHERTHTGVNPYQCNQCNQSFTVKKSLKEHMLKHSGTRPFLCDICGSSFLRKRNLVEHVKRHSSGKAKDSNNMKGKTEKKNLKCRFCGKMYQYAVSFKRHMDQHRQEACKNEDGLQENLFSNSESDQTVNILKYEAHCIKCGKKVDKLSLPPATPGRRVDQSHELCECCKKSFGRRSLVVRLKKININEYLSQGSGVLNINEANSHKMSAD